MKIGEQYSDNKIYRDIKHYDGLPLTSGDLHEHTDTLYMKNAYLMNNIIGHGGILNSPGIIISSQGIRLDSPAVLLVEGDIALIYSGTGRYLVPMSDIIAFSNDLPDYIVDGTIGILSWYQEITSNSTMRDYGGVNNEVIENDLVREPLDIQASTRYQLRWAPILIESRNISSCMDSGLSCHVSVPIRSENGDIISGTPPEELLFLPTSYHGDNNERLYFAESSSMEYIVDQKLYLSPLLRFQYDKTAMPAQVTGASMYLPVKPKGTAGFINSDSEPTGVYSEGTTWYNPSTREFKTYVKDTGFVESASKMAFLQYQSTQVLESSSPIIPMNISSYQEGDILQVIYEGLSLVNEENYTIDVENQAISLSFTPTIGDMISITVTRIIEATDISNITSTVTSHIIKRGSSSIEGHVKLSDILSTSDSAAGVAATPKLVKDTITASKLIIDDSTNKSYKIGMNNGSLYIEEVE